MSLQKKTLKESEVSTDINLKELMGDLSNNKVVRNVFLQMALDKLQERLDSGRGVDGKLAPYSQSYKDSASYKIWGKSSTVNMQLSGDMLAAIKELNSSNGKIKIGIDDSTEAAKAYGHMTGMKGHPTLAGKVPVRNWFGWTDKELEQIATELTPEAATQKETITDQDVLRILERMGFG
jgi:hypothetical protein